MTWTRALSRPRSSSGCTAGGVAPSDQRKHTPRRLGPAVLPAAPALRARRGSSPRHVRRVPRRTSPTHVSPAASAASRRAGRHARAQLVVLAAGRRELDGIGAERRRDRARRPARSAAPRASSTIRTPLACASRRASDARPSDRSSIALAPAAASARPSASRGSGRRWRAHERRRRRGARRSSTARPAADAPSVAGHADEVAGLRAVAPDELLGRLPPSRRRSPRA